jgi:hypothetical protein
VDAPGAVKRGDRRPLAEGGRLPAPLTTGRRLLLAHRTGGTHPVQLLPLVRSLQLS